MNLRIAQDATYKQKDWWEWSVWIEGDSEDLDHIKSVTYHLHPTFPDPERVVKDRRRNFRLSAAGWGTFTINADIRLKNGKVIKRSHQLVLEYSDKRRRVEQKKKQPTVFIASSVADRPLVTALEKQLESAGMRTTTDKDIETGLPFEISIERAIQGSDAAVIVVSDLMSPWLERETRIATAAGLPVIPVRVGTGISVPDLLRQVQSVDVKDAGDIQRAAREIESAVQRLLGTE